ncbi:MAG: hypothetical protein AAB658_03045 [Chloroflexota bacterium]
MRIAQGLVGGVIGGSRNGLVRRLRAAGGGAQMTPVKVVPPSLPARRRHPLDEWEQAMVEVPDVPTRPWLHPRDRWILRGIIGVCIVVQIVVMGLICWMLLSR